MPNGQILKSSRDNFSDISKQNGVAFAQYLLLDDVQAVDVGQWMPWAPFHKGSFELTSIGSFVGTAKLLASNAAVMPGNGVTLTVAGSETTGDTLTVAISHPFFGTITAHYVVKNTDTTATLVATGLTAAINAAIRAVVAASINDYIDTSSAGEVSASSLNAVITILANWPITGFVVTTSLSVGATETLTQAQYDSGAGFLVPSCSVTAVGNVIFDQPAMWIKAAVSAYTSGGITGIVAACLP